MCIECLHHARMYKQNKTKQNHHPINFAVKELSLKEPKIMFRYGSPGTEKGLSTSGTKGEHLGRRGDVEKGVSEESPPQETLEVKSFVP